MRVLFLLMKIDCNDGITSYCETLAGGLKAADVPVDLVCGGIHCKPGEEHRWQAMEANLVSWKVVPRLRTIPDPASLVALRSHIRTHGITVINVHGLRMLLWGKLLAITTGLPVVATYHPSIHGELDQLSELSRRPLSFTEKAVLRWCAPDRLVVLSSESARYLVQECPRIRNSIVKVNGAVDDTHFRPPTAEERAAARRRLQLADEDVTILHVGRMSLNKGHDLLIDAVRQVRNGPAGRRLRCLFVGSGGEENQIKERAYQDEEDRTTFTFLGFVKDLREALWAADIFALPSRLEGFALAVVEAMCAGLVAVRTPSGGAADQIVDGKTGIIVPFENAGKLAEAIALLSDSVKRAEIRSNSLAYAGQRFTRAAMTRRMMTVYEEVGGGQATSAWRSATALNRVRSIFGGLQSR